MISLAEPPIEYAPRGRAVVDEHSSATKQGKWPHMPSQNILLQRLRNVNISEKQVFKEFWSIRDIYKRCDSGPRKNKYFKEKDKDCSSKTTATTTGNEKPFAKVSDCQSEEEFVDLEAECNQVPKLVPNGININMYDFLVNSEEELYVKGHTAVWTKGIFMQQRHYFINYILNFDCLQDRISPVLSICRIGPRSSCRMPLSCLFNIIFFITTFIYFA